MKIYIPAIIGAILLFTAVAMLPDPMDDTISFEQFRQAILHADIVVVIGTCLFLISLYLYWKKPIS